MYTVQLFVAISDTVRIYVKRIVTYVLKWRIISLVLNANYEQGKTGI